MQRQAVAKVQNHHHHVRHSPAKPARSATAAHPLNDLQQSIGSQAVQRLINSPFIQTKLQVSTPEDPLEQEADRVAETVMRMTDPKLAIAGEGKPLQAKPLATGITPLAQRAPGDVIHRMCTGCEQEKEDHKEAMVHRKAAFGPGTDDEAEDEEVQAKGAQSATPKPTPSLSANIYAMNGGGSPLPETTRAFFEPRFGADFRQVRVHTGSPAAETAKAINASAFTVGSHIAFGAGRYAPHTHEGQQLLAHELTHTIQQGASAGSFASQNTATGVSQSTNISRSPGETQIQRQPAKPITGGKLEPEPKCPKGASAAGNTAKDAASLVLSPATKGSPCACLLVIHNNEENARKTAVLMHQHCTYNLALLNSGAATRCVQLPGHAGENFDPNAFFDPEIAKQCLNDESACRNVVATKSGTTDKSEIDQFVQISFFLALKDCSNSFSMPVIVLHNNTIEETKNYRKEKAGKDVTDLKVDITKGKKEDDAKKIKPLQDLLKNKFSPALQKGLTDRRGQTNIFRWCASEELSRCHIGDPNRPDQVIWVTNQADFDKLSQKDVNVVLQDDPSRVGEESKTDLSTLFLSLKEIMGSKAAKEITQLTLEMESYIKRYVETLAETVGLIAKGTPAGSVANLRMIVLQGMLELYLKEIMARKTAIDAALKEQEKFRSLQFINIETPIERLSAQTDAGRIENYELIVSALRALKLHCCGGKESEAEAKVKEGLTVNP